MSRLRKILGYEVLATLGYGARSTIFAVRDKAHHVYAMKRVVVESPKDERYVQQALREHEVAAALNHINLRRSIKFIRQRKLLRTTDVYVLMEMVDGHSFEKREFDGYHDFCNMFMQVASGLIVVHERGFAHADIKPNNILVTDNNVVKIIDFGQSCRIGTTKERIQGTPDYIAPEQVKRRKITTSTDIFNLGATMYWGLTREHVPTLIPRPEHANGRKKTGDCPPPHEINSDIPLVLSALAMQCIKTKPGDRPDSMLAVKERLQLAISQLERRKSTGAVTNAQSRAG